MVIVHYIENSVVLLTQLKKEVPVVDQEIKIKGKKGKVTHVVEPKENTFQVYVQLEKLVKTNAIAVDNKKKRK
ncbi:hypothetical protein [Bacillus sp. B1-b2]|uniref:hypothetical protein n=1 Tax=Bacillus sp. B1-b2 TaxID=2653201 RepID=UPI001261A745|nr:hypothetical protein [Bacillus sp. B1-b2]KAB7671239.1 hypothetical protein F9279_06925 [Bacillus sp. B1-b2]